MKKTIPLLLLIAGCTTADSINADLRSKWLGRKSNEFFAMQHVNAGARSGSFGGYPCAFQVIADNNGRITDIQVSRQTGQYWYISKCKELIGQ